MSDPLITVIVPTCDNGVLLNHMVSSFITHTDSADSPYRILLVNNGSKGGVTEGLHPSYSVIEADGNKGWEGGLKLGLANTESPLVMFANDDIHIVPGDVRWLSKMAETLLKGRDKKVAAVGPMSNFVMGSQNIHSGLDQEVYSTNLLIGFCLMVRRDALDEVGGVSEGLPGGDDFDLSIRLVKAGWKLAIQGDVYVHHWGSVTGNRLEGSKWNSKEMIRDVRNAVIRRNGFKSYLGTMHGRPALL